MPTYSITESVVLSTLGISAAAASYTPSTVAFDYAVASLPFLAASNRDDPYERVLAPVRKQQTDIADNPGEQSLDGWWMRSQTDWSGGSGREYMEPASNPLAMRQFHDSRRVDVWTPPGVVTLLPAVTSSTTFAASNVRAVKASSTTMYAGAGTTIKYWNGSTWATATGFSGTIAYLLIAGSKVFATNTSGAIYAATVGSSTFSSLWTTSSGATQSWWVKQRVITAQANVLKVLDLVGGSIDSTSALYTHPDSSWTWTAAAEAPGAVLVAGYGAAGSAVYRFTLDTSGALPTLSGGAITTAELPQGEYVTSMFTYLSSYIVLVTNLGVRVGQVSDTGEVTYGPWSYEGATSGDVQAYGRFLWVGVADPDGDRHGLLRLDLSEVDDSGRCAYAWDQQIPTGSGFTTVRSLVVFADDDVAIAVDDGSTAAAVYRSGADLEADGWIRSGRIRYGTLEPKYFNKLRVVTEDPIAGSVTVDLTDDTGGSYTSVASLAEGTSASEQFTLTRPGTPQQWIQLTFNLTRSTVDTATGPSLDSWQLSSLPAVPRQQLIRVPLLCFDYERDRNGVEHGYDGFAKTRWDALVEAVADGVIVRWQEIVDDTVFNAVVEDLSFKQTAPPSNASGFGGIITITLRTVA